MRRGELKAEWRGKVNPLFVLGVQFLRFFDQLAKQLHQPASDIEEHAPAILAQICKEMLRLLSDAPPGDPRVKQELVTRLKSIEDDWFSAPEVCELCAEIIRRIQHAPRTLLMKGLEKPHWWMAHKQWSEMFREGRFQESLRNAGRNALALLYFKRSTRELEERAMGGDLYAFADLLKIDKKILLSPMARPFIEAASWDAPRKPFNFGDPLGDLRAIVNETLGKSLAFREEPLRHEIKLAMTLFFGWDFGVRVLSVKELHSFLVDIKIIREQHDEQTLRKYRDRMVRDRRMPPPLGSRH